MDAWLNYHHLYYFKTIAAEGSIAKASRVLRLGQPTLSTQLRQLEEKLGIPLFERQHKKLILTEQGRIALEYAQEIFRMGSEMVEVLHDRLRPERPHVQLGALDSISKNLISRMVETAYRLGPCTVSVLEGNDAVLMRELLAHRIDLILTNYHPAVSDGTKIFTRTIARAPVLVCGAAKFKHLRKGFPKSLNGQPFVMPTAHSKLRLDLDHYFETQDVRPDIVAETQDTSLQKLLGAKGFGLLPTSRLATQSLVRDGKLVEIGRLEGISEEIFLVAADRKIKNPVSSLLWKRFALADSF